MRNPVLFLAKSKSFFATLSTFYTNPKAHNGKEIRLVILIIFWLVWNSLNGNAQIVSQFKTEQISIDEGLSQVHVRCILKDSRGFLWFGTTDGLNRYDGNEITRYKHNPSNTNSISFNKIMCLYEDAKKNIWIGTYGGGLNKFDPRTEQFVSYPYKERAKSSGRAEITNILEDENKNLWLSTRGPNSSVAIFNVNNQRFEYPDFLDPNGKKIKIGDPHDMIDDQHGTIWAASFGSGLLKIDKKTKRIRNFKLEEGLNRFKSIVLDKNGMIWIGTFDMGLLKFDPALEKFTKITIPSAAAPDGIGQINTIRRKDPEHYWIGSTKGLFDLNINTMTVKRAPYLLFGSAVHSLLDDGDILWVGMATEGVTKIIKTPLNFLHFKKYPGPKSLKSAICRGIMEADNNEIWVGSDFSGISVLKRRNSSILSMEVKEYIVSDENKTNSISSNGIYSIFKDQRGVIWVGTYDAGLNQFDKHTHTFHRYKYDPHDSTSISEDRTYELIDDAYGNIFVGTETGGLSVFIRDQQKFKRCRENQKKEYQLKSNSIGCFVKDEKKNIWVGGNKGGLYRFSDEVQGFFRYTVNDTIFKKGSMLSLLICNDTLWAGTNMGLFLLDLKSATPNPLSTDELVVKNFIQLDEHNSLPNNIINGILQDKRGNMWVSTNKGLSCINKKSLAVKNYVKQDGLQDEFNIGSFAKTSDGYFIFGGVDGLTIFHPDSLSVNTRKPEIVITNLNILNETVKPGANKKNRLTEDISFTKTITLEHSDNIIHLEFSSLDYINPKMNQYAYKMDGFDKDWVYSGNKRTATYTNLDPGTYTFRVKGSNNDGVWNEDGASLQITILPPLWKTWWAFVLYGLSLLSVIYVLWRRWVTREKLKSLALLKSAEAEKLREIDIVKSRFFANISHEFRTPLTLILNPLERRIASSTDTDEKVELSIMHRNASRLLTLINQLLDLSRLEAGTLKLKCVYGDIHNALLTLASQFSSIADSKEIEFEMIVNEPVWLFFDQDKVEKVIGNLLANAFKFTPAKGRITLSLTSCAPDPFFKNGYAEINVTDTGAGIDRDQLSKIFDRFFQVDMSSTRAYEGSGIGLSLTKELVELHHGTIEVQSELGKGSTFMVRLPLGKEHFKPGEMIIDEGDLNKIPNTRVAIEEIPHTPHTNGQQHEESVLIIEDNADLRFYIRSELQRHYKILEAVDGEEGVAIAIHEIPNLIISDLMMPKKDGLEVCRLLKEDERTSHVPIILLTAKVDVDARLRGYEQGADDYISKPFIMNELLIRIKNLIDLRKKLQARFVQLKEVLPAEAITDTVDGRFLKKAVQVVESHISDSGFGVEPLSKELAMSQTQLYRKMQALTGSGPNEFIRNIRLMRAADLLRKRAGNVTEVAYEAGFNNLSYFSKVFKEKFGLTPIEYLKNPTEKDS